MAKVKIGNILNCIFNRGALSTIWSSTAAYTAGQYVAYGNYIYKCIKNASAGTVPTNTTYWVKTDLASEITSLNSNYVNIKSPKLLWSGNFSSGSLKVPGISKYDIVAYFVDNEYACIGTPAHGVGGYIHFGTAGKGGYYVYSFSYTSSNETIAITDSFKGVIDVDSSSSAAVQKIYGIA